MLSLVHKEVADIEKATIKEEDRQKRKKLNSNITPTPVR